MATGPTAAASVWVRAHDAAHVGFGSLTASPYIYICLVLSPSLCVCVSLPASLCRGSCGVWGGWVQQYGQSVLCATSMWPLLSRVCQDGDGPRPPVCASWYRARRCCALSTQARAHRRLYSQPTVRITTRLQITTAVHAHRPCLCAHRHTWISSSLGHAMMGMGARPCAQRGQVHTHFFSQLVQDERISLSDAPMVELL
jgi:hypothetical protein